MEYQVLLDMATELGYRLSMCGAETYRVEESIKRMLQSYGIRSEIFALPNCLTVSMETPEGENLTRMRRIGNHGNDLDAVERYNALSRRICSQHPSVAVLSDWLDDTGRNKKKYPLAAIYLGNFLGAFGFALFFRSTFTDALFAGVCGLIVGLMNIIINRLEANQIFRLIVEAYIASLIAYGANIIGLVENADTVIIGTLMLMLPGLVFTNAMRDIIYGDTYSGINRIVQVFLISIAIAVGTGVAWKTCIAIWAAPTGSNILNTSFLLQSLGCLIGCIGFSLLFNIHGPGGVLCVIGGLLAWLIYSLILEVSENDIFAYFVSAVTSSIYAEVMARIRKYPAISYLVVSIFPLIPGSGIYYTMYHIFRGDTVGFSQHGIHTAAIAGVMAVGILLASSIFRITNMYRRKPYEKN